MGIFGALTTAVTGLRAQSFALENISGNIANSQTTAFKRIDTSFQDLIPDNIPSKQLAGSVQAYARATNTVQGDLQSASISTFMAINGEGFFVVQKPSSFTDGLPVFDGTDLYTRRGDFQPNKDGYLVNGAGYYLMGIPIDAKTGNLAGSVPTLLKFQNDFLPAQATTQVEYRANLASYPLTPAHDKNVVGSELLNPATFQANPIAGAPTAAKITGVGANKPDQIAAVTGTGIFADAAVTQMGVGNGGTLTISVTPTGGGAPTSYNVTITDANTLNNIVATINGTAGLNAAVVASVDGTAPSQKLKLTAVNADFQFAVAATSTDATTTRLGIAETNYDSRNLLTQGLSPGEQLTIQVGALAPYTITFGTAAPPANVSTIAELAAHLAATYPAANGTASVDSNGNLTLIASGSNTIAVTPPATAAKLGMTVYSAQPANGTVIANDLTPFLNQTMGGGAITAFDVSGSPVNIQLRWAKVDSTTLGAGNADKWNLFYQVNANATGTQVAWQNAGVTYTFGPNGQMNPLVANLTLPNVVVNGVPLGNLQVVHGAGGVTQFSDPNGTVQVNLLSQNGFPAGSLQTVAVSDKGRVVGTYSNGRTIDLADITLATFNGANALKRLDGGAFARTDESGSAILGAPGKIVGSSLEGSNTDIADEFTKLIVTQQAYSANTRIITTSNQMVQDLLNMLR